MLSLIAVILIITCIWTGCTYGSVSDAYWVTFTFAIILSVSALITQGGKYYCHIHDFEAIKEIKADKLVYQEEAKFLTDQFKLYLAESYPEHEKSIFSGIKPDNVAAYALKYPEIKGSETFIKLCDEIKRTAQNVYSCDRRINQLKKDLKVRERTMYLFGLPILPSNI